MYLQNSACIREPSTYRARLGKTDVAIDADVTTTAGEYTPVTRGKYKKYVGL